ncbi:MAG: hypothetical protein ACR2MX_04275 [Cyclobacteriaceae bacterium]
MYASLVSKTLEEIQEIVEAAKTTASDEPSNDEGAQDKPKGVE